MVNRYELTFLKNENLFIKNLYIDVLSHLHHHGRISDVHRELIRVPAQVRRACVGVHRPQHAKPTKHTQTHTHAESDVNQKIPSKCSTNGTE